MIFWRLQICFVIAENFGELALFSSAKRKAKFKIYETVKVNLM